MDVQNILAVKAVGIERAGYRKPSVLVSPHLLDRLGFSHQSIVEVQPLGLPESTVTAYVELDATGDRPHGSCALSASLTAAFDERPNQIEIKEVELVDATRVKVGKPSPIHHDLTGLGAPKDAVKDLEDRVLDELKTRRGPIHAGHTERVSGGKGEGDATVYVEVEEVSPELVARMSEDTTVLVKGRDFH